MIEEEISLIKTKGNTLSVKTLPNEVQKQINDVMNGVKTDKTETKELVKGVLLGGVLGVIICLHRQKNVWLGVLAGGLIGGYIAKTGVLKIEENE